MTRYLNDQNKVVLLHESGTYAFTSGNGQWIGEVISNDITDEEGKIIDRFMGTGRRNFDSIVPGPRDVTGTIVYQAQDMRIPFWAIGSTTDSGTSTTIGFHRTNEVNTDVWNNPFISGGTGQSMPPLCFTIEDSKISPGTGRNFVRTVKGCVPDSVRVIATQGEKVKIECDYIGQTLAHSSGATTSVTVPSTTPYLWNNCTLVLSGAGANETYNIATAKDITFEIQNNIVAPHYLNGSRDIDVPIVGNKDYLLTVTMDLMGTQSDAIYSGLYKQNKTFNTTFELNGDTGTTGSLHTIFFLSGCKMMNMTAPSELEGTTESVMEIRPRIVIGSAHDMTLKYNIW
jgi:hypothetical protein